MLTLLHSERPKFNTILAYLSAVGLIEILYHLMSLGMYHTCNSLTGSVQDKAGGHCKPKLALAFAGHIPYLSGYKTGFSFL